MKRGFSLSFVSMVSLLHVVNVWGADLKSPRPLEASSDFQRLTETIKRVGDDDTLSAIIAPMLGVVGTPPVKGPEIISHPPAGEERREFAIVYSDAQNPPTSEKTPLFIYIRHGQVTGHTVESRWFRTTLTGDLDKVLVLRGKVDDNGKAITGSGGSYEESITSRKVRKQFKAELSYWINEWLPKIEENKTKPPTSTTESKRQ